MEQVPCVEKKMKNLVIMKLEVNGLEACYQDKFQYNFLSLFIYYFCVIEIKKRFQMTIFIFFMWMYNFFVFYYEILDFCTIRWSGINFFQD